ncbi:MAG: hypothetical protein J6W29_09315 [Neisseriaceae bacterium]|nr:hypothetical protein [Neisseriaceae bacterium]
MLITSYLLTNISPYRANGGQECPPYNGCIFFGKNYFCESFYTYFRQPESRYC